MYLNSCGGAGERYKSASSLVLNSRAGGLQQVVDAADKPGTLRRVSMANLQRENKSSKSSDIKAALLVVCCCAVKLQSDKQGLNSLCKSAPRSPAGECHQKCELGQYTC